MELMRIFCVSGWKRIKARGLGAALRRLYHGKINGVFIYLGFILKEYLVCPLELSREGGLVVD